MPESTGPNLTQAGAAWKTTVEAEHAQSDRFREVAGSEDFWRSVAHRFVPPNKGEPTSDDTFDRLAGLIASTGTVLDVGAGGGRLAIPLAEVCTRVTAVEPSEAMREQLASAAAARGVSNIDLVAATWEEAEVESHDLVICAHVVYTAREIESFISKLTAHAQQAVALVVFDKPAMAPYLPLWSKVHGEERISLPSLPEVELLLPQMGIKYRKIPLRPRDSRAFKTREQALNECMARLFIAPGSNKATVLAEVLDESLVEIDRRYRFEWDEPRRPWLVVWDV